MKAQNFEKHQWEDRVIVVASPTFENSQATKQLDLLKQDIGALNDRKLVVYHVTNSGYTVDFDETIKFSNGTSAISGFRVSLIGLDGSEKFYAITIQKGEKFFSLIDKMPMRKAEIKHGNNE